MSAVNLILPLLLTGLFLYGSARGVDVYSALIKGAGQGLGVLRGIFPPLILLLTGVGMLRASGALEALSLALGPLLARCGIPGELLPLMLLRPFSGAGAMSIGAELMETYGPDSYLGRCASVMLGSTETTFYVVAVYFGAVGIGKTRYAIPAALCADGAGFLLACFWVRLLF